MIRIGLYIAAYAACVGVSTARAEEKPQPGLEQAAAEMARFRANVVDFYTAAGVDPADPVVKQALRNLEQTAGEYLEAQVPGGEATAAAPLAKDAKPQNLKKNIRLVPGCWPDLGPEIGHGFNSAFWSRHVRAHYDRLLLMAQAYGTPNQSLYRSTALKRGIEAGLKFAAPYIYESMDHPGMNDPRQVRVPMRLGPILILMQQDLDPAVQADQIKLLLTLRSNVGTREKPRQGFVHPGPNLYWTALNRMYLASLTGDAETMDWMGDCINESFDVPPTADEGIQPDNSFHYHGPLLTSMSYGSAYAQLVGEYGLLTEGTRYAVDPAKLKAVADFVADGMLWNRHQNWHAPSTIGRAITRKLTPSSGGRVLLYWSDIPSERRDAITAAAKSMLTTWDFTNEAPRGHLDAVDGALGVEIAGLVSRAKSSPVAAAMPSGHKHYPYSDYTVHRRPDYFMSVKMHSKRMLSGETAYGDGLQTWYLSDGMTYVVAKGDEYLERDVLATLDWRRLPGTTVERQERNAHGNHTFGTRPFVGGAHTDRYGVSAMDCEPNRSQLTAKKSWFFFDDEVVCLGSDITCPTTNHVETIVNQWPLSQADAPLILDGELAPPASSGAETSSAVTWAQCDGMGYYFPGGQTIQIKRSIQSGKWTDIGSYQQKETCENPFLTLWYDHGPKASNRTYAYALVPNQSRDRMRQYAASKPFTVLSQTGDVHAVKHSGVRAVGAVFWRPGSVDLVSVDRSCIVFYQSTDKTLTLAVSDPTHGDDTIRERTADEGVPGVGGGKVGLVAGGPARRPATRETVIHVTVQGRLSGVDLPDNVTASQVGNRTEITIRARDGRNYVTQFTTESV